jgi:hypothetical protein
MEDLPERVYNARLPAGHRNPDSHPAEPCNRPVRFRRCHLLTSVVLPLSSSVRQLPLSIAPHAKADGLGLRRRKNPALPESRRHGLHCRSPIFFVNVGEF